MCIGFDTVSQCDGQTDSQTEMVNNIVLCMQWVLFKVQVGDVDLQVASQNNPLF